MTPERASRVVARWVRFYTADLAPSVADRRVEELDADLHDQIAHERAVGTADGRIAISVLSRMVRGMLADLTWRGHVHPMKGDRMREDLMKPLVGVLVAALGIAALALVLDSPALVLVAITAIVGVSVVTFAQTVRTALEGNFLGPYIAILAGTLAIAALAIFAIVWGESDDAPGLVLLGTVLIGTVIVGAFSLGVRTARASRR
jgi:hypothetical protein